MTRVHFPFDRIRCVLLILWAVLPLTVWCGQNHAGDDAKPAVDVAKEQQQASEWSVREMARLTVGAASGDSSAFQSTTESVLKWSNPDAGRVYGDVYVWTDGGRPAAVASIYRWYAPYQSLTIEFCSLSAGPIVASRGGQVLWQPADPGIAWHELPASAAPARSRPARLTQMRRMADRFTVRLTDSRADQAAVDKVLRLLSRPVYRYDEAMSVDGALFAFVVGTDPELLLLLESDEAGWRYALTRINRDTLAVSLDGAMVRKFEYIPPAELFDLRQPYACYDVKDYQLTETAP